MDKAVLSATYSDFKLIRTRKVVSISFEVPLERANEINQILGLPDPAMEKWVAICPLNTGAVGMVAMEPPTSDYGDYAKALKLSHFFAMRDVLRKIGAPDEHLEWIQKQPSCISERFSEYVNGEGRCIAAHVRRAGDAGIGYKPPYMAVPLTDEEHRQQHNHGESSLHRDMERSESTQWFTNKAMQYAEEWAWEKFKKFQGVSSMREVSPDAVIRWSLQNQISHCLPPIFQSYLKGGQVSSIAPQYVPDTQRRGLADAPSPSLKPD